METLDLMKELGMTEAVGRVEKKLEKNRKLFTAYQNYSFIPKEAVEKFNQKLREKTEVIYDKQTKEIRKKVDPKKWNEIVYDKLTFTPLAKYGEVPPVEVLRDVKKAVEMGCFDAFEVAKVESVKEIVDPIVFGKIDGCTDLFFIAQWDNDVKFEDLQKEAGDVQ